MKERRLNGKSILSPVECCISIWLKLEKKDKITFFSTCFIGIFIHMYMLTNKLPNYDDSCFLFELGTGSDLGRWIIDLIWKISVLGNSSMPWWNGIISILLIAAAVCILCRTLEIKETANCILIGGLVVSFPTLTCVFTFMFMSVIYCLSVLLAVTGAYVIKKHRYGILTGACILVVSLGIYQANWSMAAVTLLLTLIVHCLDEKHSYGSIMKEAFRYLGALLLSMVLYLSSVKVFNWFVGSSLSEYQGVNEMGKLDIGEIPHNIIQAYKSYLELCSIKPPQLTSAWFVNDEKIVRLLLATGSLFSIGLLCYVLLAGLKKRLILIKMELSLLAVLFPIAVLIIYFMINNRTGIYLIMIYSVVFTAILPIVFIDKLNWKFKKNWAVFCLWGITLVSAGLIFCWGTIANRTYLAMQLRHECVKTYYTTLITQIKQLDGYRADYPVALVGKLNDPALTDYKKFGNRNIMRVADADPESFINTHPRSQENFLKYYCGYQYAIAENPDEIKKSAEFIEMSTYPDDNSIKILNGTVVVKLSD